jgi:hypothetical protein
MAVEVELDTIAAGFSLSKVNSNFETIAGALQDALSRTGTSPNSMEADIDMDGHDLLNVGALDVESLTIDGDVVVFDDALAVGADGEAATITVGTVTTGAAGSSVVVTNVGTSLDAVLDFTIPRGATGASGAGSGDMVAAQNLSDVASAVTSFTNIKQAATTSTSGVVELATSAETITGTDTTRALTAAGLTAKLDDQDGYRFLTRRVFTSNTSYTPTTGATYIHVVMCGGGGGGGGADTDGAAGGGSGAETIDFWMLVSALSPPVTLVVGDGGSGGSAAGGDGSNGVDSSFGSVAIAKRGIGGAGATTFTVEAGANRSSNGTVPSGGLRFQGSDGGTGSRGDGGAGSQVISLTSGYGGNSYLGGGGRAVEVDTSISVAGRDGGSYGGGGSGAVSKSTSGAAGGDGADGIIIIEEYVSGS